MRAIRPDLELFEEGCWEDGSFSAVFELSDEERATIANGGQFMVTIAAAPIPPISVQAVHVGEAAGEEREGVPFQPDYRCRDCGALYVCERAIEHDFVCGHCGNELRLPGAAD